MYITSAGQLVLQHYKVQIKFFANVLLTGLYKVCQFKSSSKFKSHSLSDKWRNVFVLDHKIFYVITAKRCRQKQDLSVVITQM